MKGMPPQPEEARWDANAQPQDSPRVPSAEPLRGGERCRVADRIGPKTIGRAQRRKVELEIALDVDLGSGQGEHGRDRAGSEPSIRLRGESMRFDPRRCRRPGRATAQLDVTVKRGLAAGNQVGRESREIETLSS